MGKSVLVVALRKLLQALQSDRVEVSLESCVFAEDDCSSGNKTVYKLSHRCIREGGLTSLARSADKVLTQDQKQKATACYPKREAVDSFCRRDSQSLGQDAKMRWDANARGPSK